MDAKLVQRLVSRDPGHSSWSDRSSNLIRQTYLNPAVGWYIAASTARARLRFQETVIGRNHWLFRAYTHILNPSVHSDHNVEEAHTLSKQSTSATLKAMLIAGLGDPVDEHLDLVAEKFGTSRRTVEAFEILFFNVLDRHKDGLYLSNIVYPEGRSVEFEEDYFETASIPDLLLRAAYNHRDLDLVVRLAGMDATAYAQELGDREAALEKALMGNGLVMARAGLLNQRSAGIQRASTLLTASRSSRNNPQPKVESPDFDFTSTELAAAIKSVAPMTDVDRQEMLVASRPGQNYCSDDTGKVFAVDDSDESPTPSPPSPPPEPIVRFPDPVPAVWRNKDFDKPVTLIARMSEPGLPDHYLTVENTGVPVSEVFFEN